VRWIGQLAGLLAFNTPAAISSNEFTYICSLRFDSVRGGGRKNLFLCFMKEPYEGACPGIRQMEEAISSAFLSLIII